jgi:transposase
MRPKGSAGALEARRRRAIDLLESGMSPAAVSLPIGVARQTVQKWKAWVRDGGRKALKFIAQHMNTCRLTLEQQETFETYHQERRKCSWVFNRSLDHGENHRSYRETIPGFLSPGPCGAACYTI